MMRRTSISVALLCVGCAGVNPTSRADRMAAENGSIGDRPSTDRPEALPPETAPPPAQPPTTATAAAMTPPMIHEVALDDFAPEGALENGAPPACNDLARHCTVLSQRSLV